MTKIDELNEELLIWNNRRRFKKFKLFHRQHVLQDYERNRKEYSLLPTTGHTNGFRIQKPKYTDR